MNPGLRTYKSASLRVCIPEISEERNLREIVGVQSENQGKGHATALLHRVCAEADKELFVLYLEVRPFDEGMDAAMLEHFYSQFGFVEIQAEPKLMMRAPNTRIH